MDVFSISASKYEKSLTLHRIMPQQSAIGHLIIPYLLTFRLAILAIPCCHQPFFAPSECGRVKSCNMSANHRHGGFFVSSLHDEY